MATVNIIGAISIIVTVVVLELVRLYGQHNSPIRHSGFLGIACASARVRVLLPRFTSFVVVLHVLLLLPTPHNTEKATAEAYSTKPKKTRQK